MGEYAEEDVMAAMDEAIYSGLDVAPLFKGGVPKTIRQRVIDTLRGNGATDPTDALDRVLLALTENSIGLFDMTDAADPVEVSLDP